MILVPQVTKGAGELIGAWFALSGFPVALRVAGGPQGASLGCITLALAKRRAKRKRLRTRLLCLDQQTQLEECHNAVRCPMTSRLAPLVPLSDRILDTVPMVFKPGALLIKHHQKALDVIDGQVARHEFMFAPRLWLVAC